MAEIARLVRGLLGTAPGQGLVEALHRDGWGDPSSIGRLVLRLLRTDGDPIQSLERLLSQPRFENGGAERVFRHDGDFWKIAYGGRLVRCRHSKGFAYLALLLPHPGRWIAASDIRDRVTGRKKVVTQEQARISVTKAIRATLDRVADIHPDLGRHLRVAVRTGGDCAYMPDPEHLIRWTT